MSESPIEPVIPSYVSEDIHFVNATLERFYLQCQGDITARLLSRYQVGSCVQGFGVGGWIRRVIQGHRTVFSIGVPLHLYLLSLCVCVCVCVCV